MGRKSRDKGARYENEVIHDLNAVGIDAERVPLSGACKGSYASDIRFGPALAWTGECKRFASGLAKLYEAMDQDGADVVFARADRRETVVCMSLETFRALASDQWPETKRPAEVHEHRDGSDLKRPT